MKNRDLVVDYISRAGHRLAGVEVLYQHQSWADVVREAQELIELCLKALLRHANIEPPRTHDVSQILLDEQGNLPGPIIPHVKSLAMISRKLRRDRELSYYGSEDLTPSDFYNKEDATEAFENAKWVHTICKSIL